MKGLEFNIILGIIMVILIIVLVFILVIGPAFNLSEKNKEDYAFRDACLFWSLSGYQGTSYKDSQGNPKDMNILCAKNLGVIIMSNNDDWERCKNLCRMAA